MDNVFKSGINWDKVINSCDHSRGLFWSDFSDFWITVCFKMFCLIRKPVLACRVLYVLHFVHHYLGPLKWTPNGPPTCPRLFEVTLCHLAIWGGIFDLRWVWWGEGHFHFLQLHFPLKLVTSSARKENLRPHFNTNIPQIS